MTWTASGSGNLLGKENFSRLAGQEEAACVDVSELPAKVLSRFRRDSRRPTPEVERLYAEDMDDNGYVMNTTRMFAHQPALFDGLFDLQTQAHQAASLSIRQRGVLIAAMASTLGDSYCSLAWGERLARRATPALTAGLIGGDDSGWTEDEQALAAWARKVVRDPNGTTAEHLEPLRRVGYTDAKIVAITAFVTLRMAWSTMNDALGVRPDPQLGASAPPALLEAVSYGRTIDEATRFSR